MNVDDEQLIEACLAGKGEAFGQLVERHQHRLFGVLVKMLGSAEEARDVAQDAFVQAYQKLETFRGGSAFSTWLTRIAINAAISRKRRHRREQTSLDAARADHGLEPTDPHTETQPSHAMEQLERQQLVQQALAALPEEFRIVLVLKEMEGMKYDEIADSIGIPIGTVRSRIHRARAELKEKLQLTMKAEE
ncbi:RNA polymerase sigma factor [Calycomorphotria hydatis]|uniref:ECF RNA polymerase sigma-E factor n=1 Tax=Calycomorphotria hydatis TaxID=2528027 RepID=A0A517T5L9_9PLAN|nr:sigma-70 family RNA polymerase sigma factor [Calycomorphotria hydatis]QDT63669.1 ECF RNA polymerase sigma-E factor [Calycomorphotria hydatis]